jgi:hypothetical protein
MGSRGHFFMCDGLAIALGNESVLGELVIDMICSLDYSSRHLCRLQHPRVSRNGDARTYYEAVTSASSWFASLENKDVTLEARDGVGRRDCLEWNNESMSLRCTNGGCLKTPTIPRQQRVSVGKAIDTVDATTECVH